MPDEPIHEQGRISIPDAIRLKYNLGKSITWGNSNLNAAEIEQLTELDATGYAQIRKEYADWQKHMTVFNNYAVIAMLVGSIVALFIFSGWLRNVAEAVAILSGYMLIKREGHADGYVSGYEAGHEAGVYRTLGIKQEDIPGMATMATDMKIDEMLVQRMDEREKLEAEKKK